MDIPEGVDPESVDEFGDWPWTLDELTRLKLPETHPSYPEAKASCPLCMMMNNGTRLATQEAAQYVADHHRTVT